MTDEIQNEDLNPILDTIDGAEEMPDLLDGLVEKSAEDPGSAFTPAMLEGLVVLKRKDHAAFETLRARLKKAGCRVTELDKAMTEETVDGERGRTQADILIAFAGRAELFHSADGKAFADVITNNFREIWPVRSRDFRCWLEWQFFEDSDGVPNSRALQSALNVIEGRARFGRPERRPERFCREADVQCLPIHQERRLPGAGLWMACNRIFGVLLRVLRRVLIEVVVEALMPFFNN